MFKKIVFYSIFVYTALQCYGFLIIHLPKNYNKRQEKWGDEDTFTETNFIFVYTVKTTLTVNISKQVTIRRICGYNNNDNFKKYKL